MKTKKTVEADATSLRALQLSAQFMEYQMHRLKVFNNAGEKHRIDEKLITQGESFLIEMQGLCSNQKTMSKEQQEAYSSWLVEVKELQDF